MKMRISAALAIGAASVVLAFSLTLSAPVLAQSTPQPSKAAAKPLKEASDAMRARKYDAAMAKLKEVQALPNKSPYDVHLMNEMLGFLYFRANDYPSAVKALEPGLTSGFLKESDVPRRVRDLAGLYLRMKNYSKAIEYGQRAVKGGYADDTTYSVLEQAYYYRGNHKETLKFVSDYVDGQIRRGQKPKERSLQTMMQTCTKLQDTACETRALQRLVSYYPKPEYWQNLLDSLFRQDNDDPTKLQLFRFASEVDVLKRADDYSEMAQLAIELGAPGEAVRILEKGFKENVFPDQRTRDKNQRLLASAKKNAATEQAALPKLEKEAAADQTGAKDIELGLALLSYQQYPKAIEVLKRGIQKSSGKNVAEAHLLLGIAQLKAANKAEAVKSFQAVKGDAKLEQIADLWALHARQA